MTFTDIFGNPIIKHASHNQQSHAGQRGGGGDVEITSAVNFEGKKVPLSGDASDASEVLSRTLDGEYSKVDVSVGGKKAALIDTGDQRSVAVVSNGKDIGRITDKGYGRYEASHGGNTVRGLDANKAIQVAVTGEWSK